MTKQEFLDYIKSFGKNPGEYTEEEVYDIGRKHKLLPLGVRNWTELAEMLGSVGQGGKVRNGEALRTFIKQKQYEDNSIIHNERMLSGRTVNDLSYEEAEAELAKWKQDLYIQQVKTRDEANAFRSTLRDEARIQRFTEEMKDAISKIPALPVVDDYEEYEAEEGKEAVLLFSDLHIGAQIDNFYNKYNVAVAKARVKKLVYDTIKYCRAHNVQVLHFTNLGDLCAGNIHISARLLQEIDVVEQVMTAAEILAEALNELQAAIPVVNYRSCLDNHSRVTPNLKEHIEKENFGRLIDFYLKARLESTNINFMEDNLDENIGLIELQNGKKMIFVHGHQDSVNTVIQNYTAAIRDYVDYVALGHYHSSKAKTFQNSKVFVNGSIIGTDDYALSHRLFGIPEQTLLVFDRDNLLNITLDLRLDQE